ncbi:hypothetical protein WME94_21275 [Sorangium sp. So ce429]
MTVLWRGHGIEADPSRAAFRALPAAERASALLFVGSLRAGMR